MISSRDLNDLHPAVKRRALAMISACDADGITLLITSTYRDNASQDKLYAQGRGGACLLSTTERQTTPRASITAVAAQ